MSKLSPDQLEALTARTLGHYEASAESFRDGTWSHDVSQNISALLSAISGTAPFRILDLGCGPGRDLVRFRELGHEAVGLDGTPSFVEMARSASGCEVWHQNFLKLELPLQHFDGIFANASLFHVPSAELPRVLGELRSALREGGVLFTSNPRGDDTEGFNGERYGAFHSYESWSAYVAAAGFAPVTHYYRPEGKPRHEQPWLASVWRKTSGR